MQYLRKLTEKLPYFPSHKSNVCIKQFYAYYTTIDSSSPTLHFSMSNYIPNPPDSPETEHVDDSNFELPDEYLMIDGWWEDYQSAPPIQSNIVQNLDTDGSSYRQEGPERSGGRREREVRERFAFRTQSDVEVLDDGYKWRKYGKKKVKNSPNPRNYYRCSIEGCLVKKRVERDRDDPSYVITTYEGIHNHQSS